MARTTSALAYSKSESAEKNAIILADSTGHFFTWNGELWRVVHKYPNIQNVNILPLFLHHCKCPFLSMQLDTRLSLTKLWFLWSWCLPKFLHKQFTNFTFHIIICTQISKYPNGCYLHLIIMHRTVIASIIKAITVLCV